MYDVDLKINTGICGVANGQHEPQSESNRTFASMKFLSLVFRPENTDKFVAFTGAKKLNQRFDTPVSNSEVDSDEEAAANVSECSSLFSFKCLMSFT